MRVSAAVLYTMARDYGDDTRRAPCMLQFICVMKLFMFTRHLVPTAKAGAPQFVRDLWSPYVSSPIKEASQTREGSDSEQHFALPPTLSTTEA